MVIYFVHPLNAFGLYHRDEILSTTFYLIVIFNFFKTFSITR
jgi:hypothetical protein